MKTAKHQRMVEELIEELGGEHQNVVVNTPANKQILVQCFGVKDVYEQSITNSHL